MDTTNGRSDTYTAFNPVVEWDFIFGTPFFIDMLLETDAHGGGDSGSALSDAAHSAYWGGIQQVTFNAQSVAFDVSSLSGTNYLNSFVPANSVPEPAPLALISIAALACARASGAGKGAPRYPTRLFLQKAGLPTRS